jgi:hypothetical protein
LSHWRPWYYEALLAISAANVTFLRVWVELLGRGPESEFYLKHSASPAMFAATMANILLAAALYYGVIRLLRRFFSAQRTVAALLLFFLAAAAPLNAIRSVAALQFPILRSGLLKLLGVQWAMIVVVIGALGLGAGVVLSRRRLLTLGTLALTALSPLVLFLFFQGGRRILDYDPGPFLDKPLAARILQPKGHPIRVVWVIFDELDFRLAFEGRPVSVDMPEFDKLRSESLFATQARAPFTDTIPSVPSLLSGRAFEVFKPEGPSTLLVGSDSSRPMEPWNGGSTIFSTFRQLGLNSGVAGFYIPYCRLLNDTITDCYWEAIGMALNSMGDSFPQALVNQMRSLFETSFFSPFGQSLLVRRRVAVLGRLTATAARMASDPDLGLIFVHMPAPHAPHPYDRVQKAFTKANSPFEGYLDSLALSDRLLGDLRSSITKAGLWDRTILLVSSDHPYRNSRMVDGKSDPRVPFLLKLPGRKRGIEYTTPLQTLVSRRLLESLVKGELTSLDQVVNWLPAQ